MESTGICAIWAYIFSETAPIPKMTAWFHHSSIDYKYNGTEHQYWALNTDYLSEQ